MIGLTKALIGGFVLLIGSVASAQGWPSTSVLDLSYRIDRPNQYAWISNAGQRAAEIVAPNP